MQFMGTEEGILIQIYLQTHLYKYLTLYSQCYGEEAVVALWVITCLKGLAIKNKQISVTAKKAFPQTFVSLQVVFLNSWKTLWHSGRLEELLLDVDILGNVQICFLAES